VNPIFEFMDLDPFLAASKYEEYMRQALREAEAALAEDEVPIGAVIVYEEPAGGIGRVIAAAHNQREQLRDPTAHAEMIAITQAAQALSNWRLERCTLYVTLEPCPMCAGAIVLARMPRVVYGAADPKAGAATTLFQLLDDQRLNHRAEVIAGVLADPCGQILSNFFAEKRGNTKLSPF
jgi:tRNA(adenine34) deaminase